MNIASKFGPAFTLESADAASLDQLEHQAQGCTRCELYKNATQLVFGEGSQKADIMAAASIPALNSFQSPTHGKPWRGKFATSSPIRRNAARPTRCPCRAADSPAASSRPG